MATALRILDTTPTGRRLAELRLVVDAPRISVADLIRRRIRAEVERYNATPTDRFHGLVQPLDAEPGLDGTRRPRARTIDADAQCELALRAFARNGFFLLVGDRQVTDLYEMLELTDDLEISFIKLVPLVGG